MAIGINPRYFYESPIFDTPASDFLVLALEAAHQLGWTVNARSTKGILASINRPSPEWNANITVQINKNIVRIESISAENEIWDSGKNKRLVKKLVQSIQSLKAVRTKEELQEQYASLSLDETIPDDAFFIQPKSSSEFFKKLFSFILPHENYNTTPLILGLNLAIFLVMVLNGIPFFSPQPDDLISWGANYRPSIIQGEWWRLITCNFLHFGFTHLLVNMYTFLYIGIILEPLLGKTRFLITYLLCGLAASLTSLCWHEVEVCAGASGAIFGAYGLCFPLLLTQFIEKDKRLNLFFNVAIIVCFGLMNTQRDEIDTPAHIGGFLCGIVSGIALIPSLKNPENNKLKYGIPSGIFAVLLIIFALMYGSLPTDMTRYVSQLKEFDKNETEALSFYNLPSTSLKHKKLFELKSRGIFYWEKNLKIIRQCLRMKLPARIQNKNRMLEEYCQLRIQVYELMHQDIMDGTDTYRPEILALNTKIEILIEKLQKGYF